MAKRTVPTPAIWRVTAGTFAIASMAKTSSSGSDSLTDDDQSRPSSSSHFPSPRSKRTMRPVFGPAAPAWLSCGGGRTPGDAHDAHSGLVVVRLPARKAAAATLGQLGATARAGGPSTSDPRTPV